MKILFIGDSLTEGSYGISYVKILKKKFPSYDLMNYGKNGDTIVSLFNRLKKLDLTEENDIAFLWIGTNDVLVNISQSFKVTKLCSFQPLSKSYEEFYNYYKKTLLFLEKKAEKIFIISPLFIGEDITNKWNKKLDQLSKIIFKISKEFPSASYIDIRKNFYNKLKKNKKNSNFFPKSFLGLVFDGLLNRNPEKINQTSNNRGLKFTIDGVHLNTAGAELCAKIFAEIIESFN
jgi:lysophospholipase L1-like esterase